MSNWEKQIHDHTMPNQLSYCVYYGTSRSTSATELAKFDVVIFQLLYACTTIT